MSSAQTNQTDRVVTKPRGHHAAASGTSVGGYLIQRLQEYGVRDMFGVPGDYVLSTIVKRTRVFFLLKQRRQ